MFNDETIERLLKWRLTQAEHSAPPSPRASRLLELSRPWWDTCPGQFQALWARLGKIQIAYGHAMVESSAPRAGGYPVPAVIVRPGETEVETSVRVLYLGFKGERMSLRFQLETPAGSADEVFEVTFVSEASALPLFSAPTTRSVESEYRLDVELTEELAREWRDVRVMDRMPFRLILRSSVKPD